MQLKFESFYGISHNALLALNSFLFFSNLEFGAHTCLPLLGSINTLWVVTFQASISLQILPQTPIFSTPVPPLTLELSFLLAEFFSFSFSHMARLTHFVLLFVLLFLSHELLGSEGRNLRQITIQSPDATKAMSIATKSANVIPTYRSIRSLAGDVEAFRPTTPGHSPGVGH